MKKNLPAFFLLTAIAAGMVVVFFFFRPAAEQGENGELSIVVSDGEIRAECGGESMALGESIPAALGGASVETNDTGSAVTIAYGDISVLIVEAGETVPDSAAAVLIFDGTGLAKLPENPPEYAIISASAVPGDAVLHLLESCCKTVCRVDLQGEITLTTDGQTVSLSARQEASSEEIFPLRESLALETRETTCSYVVNQNSNVFHLPSCQSVEQMKEENRIDSQLTREELIAQGYRPCGNCQP